jgi:hypothetical protein
MEGRQVATKRLRDHALFIAFAPADKPKIALAVLVENGGFGAQSAAPIARQVLDYYLLGKEPAGVAPPRRPGAEGPVRRALNDPRLLWIRLAGLPRPLVGPLDADRPAARLCHGGHGQRLAERISRTLGLNIAVA